MSIAMTSRVISALSDNKPKTGTEIAKTIGMVVSGVYIALNELLAEGKVVVVGENERQRLWQLSTPVVIDVNVVTNNPFIWRSYIQPVRPSTMDD